ncbi:MAG: gliding motility-associated C-terminal domain-containing protein, partial [Flavobacteriales bacterium]
VSVCEEVYQENNSPAGTGNVFEMAPGTCQTGGEFNSAWYVFTVQENGILNFTLQPNDNGDDYDWSLFEITDGGCAGINSGDSPEVSCNSYGETFGTQGPTGISSAQGGSGSSNGPGNSFGPPFNGDLNVTAGNVYALVVMNYSSTLNGYSLDFDGSTASIFDATPPEITAVDPGCDQSTLTVQLSENVPADLLTTGNISFETSNGTVNPVDVNYDSSPTSSFDIVMPAGFDYAGPITLVFNDPPADYCGNTLTASYDFSIDGPLDFTVTTTPACNGNNGGVEVVASGLGTACYYFSIDGVSQTAALCASVTNALLDAGTHVLVISADSSACTTNTTFAIEDVVVSIDLGESLNLCDLQTSLSPTYTGDDLIWNVDPAVSISGNGPFVFSVDDAGTFTIGATVSTNDCEAQDFVQITFNYPPEISISTNEASCYDNCDGSVTLDAVGYSSVIIEVAGLNYADNPITINNLCRGEYAAEITFAPGCTGSYVFEINSPDFLEANFTAEPWVTSTEHTTFDFTNLSAGATSFSWEMPDFPEMIESTENWSVTLPGIVGKYEVILTVENEAGCEAQKTSNIEIRDELQVFVPNAFTPNGDGINDVFYVSGTDIDPNHFELVIYNRWGAVVFYSTDPKAVWMGEFNADSAFYSPIEIYNYRISAVAQTTISSQIIKGNVVLIR